MEEDDEKEIVAEYDFSEDAMGLGDFIVTNFRDLKDHEIVVSVYDDGGRPAKVARLIRDEDGLVELHIEFERKYG